MLKLEEKIGNTWPLCLRRLQLDRSYKHASFPAHIQGRETGHRKTSNKLPFEEAEISQVKKVAYFNSWCFLFLHKHFQLWKHVA